MARAGTCSLTKAVIGARCVAQFAPADLRVSIQEKRQTGRNDIEGPWETRFTASAGKAACSKPSVLSLGCQPTGCTVVF